MAIPRFRHVRPRRAATLVAIAALAGCLKEDEELQRQLVELKAENAALKAKADAAAQAPSSAGSGPPPDAGAAAELARARSRISGLEKELAAATASKAAPQARTGFDPQALRENAARNLGRQLQALGETIERQQSGSRIREISSPKLETPPEIAKPFRTVATFSLACGDGRLVNLQFPISADLDGSWTLPGPDTIQEALRQALPASGVAARKFGDQGAEVEGFQPDPNDPNTFRFRWPEGPAPVPAADSAPRREPQPQGLSRVESAAPPAGTASGRAAPPSPPPPAPPQMTIPPATMPVQKDIIIRF